MFEALHNFLKNILESQCSKHKFLLGDKLTVADFWIGALYTNYFTNKDCYAPERWADTLRKFPKFKAYGERFATETKDYLDSRTNYPV